MRMNVKKMIGMRVETQSGAHLGLVRDMVLDSDSQSVVAYVVRKRLWGREEYYIGRKNVYRITPVKMVVDDMAVGEKKKEPVVSGRVTMVSEAMRSGSKISDPSPQ